jgi:hypothetical protein
MLGFWPQLLLVLIALYFAGTVFVGTVLGRWLLFIPVLMSFVPFVWHVQHTLVSLYSLPLVPQRFTALSLGLGIVLLAVGLVWAWYYAFSIFMFPLLTLLVYVYGPLAYVRSNLLPSTPPIQTYTISLFAALASLCFIAYTLPTMIGWLRSNKPEDG